MILVSSEQAKALTLSKLPGQHECHICSRMYKYRRGLQRHYRVFHTDYYESSEHLVEIVVTESDEELLSLEPIKAANRLRLKTKKKIKQEFGDN